MPIKVRGLSDDAIVNIAAIGAILIVTISALLVVAAAPEAGDSITVFSVGAVTAIAGFLRRPQTGAPIEK